MTKSKFDVSSVGSELDGAAAGIAHSLNLLMLAVAKSHPAVGTLLDEFTALHADYLAEIQALARDSAASIQVLEAFTASAKQIYQRMSALDDQQARRLRAEQQELSGRSLRVH